MIFREKYYFLSNMYPCNITINLFHNDITFKCSESAFQASKCIDLGTALQFKDLDGFKAKSLGKRIKLREDWEKVKLSIMRDIVLEKFIQNSELLDKLLLIEGDIVEDNTWGDHYWGRCNGVGTNYLGKILKAIRDNAKEIIERCGG